MSMATILRLIIYNDFYVLSNSFFIGSFDYYDYNYYVRFPLIDGLMFIVVQGVY